MSRLPHAASGKSSRLAAALIAAQLELRAPTKNRNVSVRAGRENYDFAYATLDSIVEQVLRPVLPGHGLWFLQYTQTDGDRCAMVTEILHSSGESRICPLLMPEMPSNPHDAGALVSYFRRYALCAAFGLVAEDDDESRLIGGEGDGLLSAEQLTELESLAGGSQPEIERLCRYMKVGDLRSLPAAKFDRARAALKVRRAA